MQLKLIKAVHTLIWLFFNVVIFYMLYASFTGRLDAWLWTGFGLVALEGLTLLVFRWTCPLTLLARKYSNSGNDNFDIYLPNWLARNTKRIYTFLTLLIILITLFRIFEM
jgi:NhaP-type Na+/H+ or K+/H+ antiporter